MSSYARFSLVTLKPAGSGLVRLCSSFLVTDLDLVYSRQILLLRRRSSEIALARVVIYRLLQHAGSVLGVGFAVGFVSFGESVGGVVGFIEVLGLDGGSALKGSTGFLT